MKKLKVMTIVGTRPEIIRLSRIISKLDEFCEHVLVHTGQNYDFELNQVFFDDMSIRTPDVFLKCAGKTSSETIAQVISHSDEVLEQLKPEAVLILGDTNSALSAISAKRRRIPIFHMEAGNRCFDLRVPEEINRKIVDHISDINLPYTDIAREHLLREGIAPDTIIKTGSPMYEVLSFYEGKINASIMRSELKLSKFQYFLVSFHREENIDSESHIRSFVEVLNSLVEIYDLPVIVSTHPRTRKRVDEFKLEFHNKIRLLKPLAFTDYVALQKDAKVVLSDSGTITEESSILNFPAINLRESHERPEGFEEGSVMFTGIKIDRILQAVLILETQARGKLYTTKIVQDYIAPNLSEKLVRIITSYTDYVKRVNWKQY